MTGILREEWRTKFPDKVFFTDSLLSAEKFAKKSAAKFGGKPVVHIVRPIGQIYHVNTNEYVADKAKIIDSIFLK